MKTIMLKPLFFLMTFLLSTPVALAQTCSFTMSNINFGNVNLLGGGSVDTTANLHIECKGTVGLTIRICPNINADSGGTSGTTRMMRNGTNQPLNYQLFQNAARTTLWGSHPQPTLGTPPTIDILLPLLGSSTRDVTLYGRLSSGQSAAAGGTYSSLFTAAQTSFYYSIVLLNVLNPCSNINSNLTPVNFQVLANVDRDCNITTQDLDFGDHGILNRAIQASAIMRVTCSTGLAYNVGLSNGLSGTSPVDRKMTRGNEAVTYGLYRDQNRTQPWGMVEGQVASGTGTGLAQNLTIYGEVPAQDTQSPGSYSDTVVVTVTY